MVNENKELRQEAKNERRENETFIESKKRKVNINRTLQCLLVQSL